MTTSEIEETIMALQDRVKLLRRQRSESAQMARSALMKLTAVRQQRTRRRAASLPAVAER